MDYLIAFYEPHGDFVARDGGDPAGFWPPWVAYFEALRTAGVNIAGAPLQAPATAVTVRDGAAGRTIHDGPYADTKEQLGGYVVFDVPSLDDALAWAGRAPCVANGAVEVRPLWPLATDYARAKARVGSEGMQYALVIYERASDFAIRESPDDAATYWSGWAAYNDALENAGIRFGGAALRGPETATTVRSGRDGYVVHDGPYADTKEQLGGVLLLDVATQDEALRWAARCPAATSGAIEVRPVLPVVARV
ncbi:MAG: YciI family protein [Vulcanimicrobiaceae bacterium]